MFRAGMLTLAAGLSLVATAAAQTTAWQFRPGPGEVLTYKVEMITQATDVVGGNKTGTTTRLNLVKRWQNLGPEQGKPGTRMQLTLASLRFEVNRPTGDNLLFDSEHPDKSTPELRNQLGKLVGAVLAVIRVDAAGRVAEVIESKHGPATNFESEPPFQLVLPSAVPQPGQSWERPYTLTLAPPQGTGEKYNAVQKYTCKAVQNGKATVAVTTVIKNPPESPLDQVPLFQQQPGGEVVFDIANGRMESATLRINKEIKDHQGKGSSYRFESLYTEQYVGNR